jgi:hypothetical protein
VEWEVVREEGDGNVVHARRQSVTGRGNGIIGMVERMESTRDVSRARGVRHAIVGIGKLQTYQIEHLLKCLRE